MTFGLYLLLNLVILIFFGLWLRGLVVRRLKPERLLADLETEVREMTQELNMAGDQNISLLEDRIGTLKTLLHRADTQIEELEGRLREVEELRYQESQEAESVTFSAPEPTVDTEEVPPENDVDQTFTIPFGGRQSREPEKPQDSRKWVLSLHEQGLSSDVIASRTGIAIGEVELIISLGARQTRT